MRDFISPAALFVNVIARIELGTIPSESKYAVIRLPGMSLESGFQSEWITGKP